MISNYKEYLKNKESFNILKNKNNIINYFNSTNYTRYVNIFKIVKSKPKSEKFKV
tara:strand:+ start:676 stop:840 length:165 start_codon:yes stop_codon:yes gene_type:complete